MYFRQFWRDPRLAYQKTRNVDKIVLSGQRIDQFWTPDTFFVNEKEAFEHNQLSPNLFLRILPNGEILLSKR